MDGSIQLGPQYQRDTEMVARMRLHQSWYRAAVLPVGWGTGPRPRGTSELGNMLNNDGGSLGFIGIETKLTEPFPNAV
jgi:hypothetical protein